jgi:hypothetical protein
VAAQFIAEVFNRHAVMLPLPGIGIPGYLLHNITARGAYRAGNSAGSLAAGEIPEIA